MLGTCMQAPDPHWCSNLGAPGLVGVDVCRYIENLFTRADKDLNWFTGYHSEMIVWQIVRHIIATTIVQWELAAQNGGNVTVPAWKSISGDHLKPLSCLILEPTPAEFWELNSQSMFSSCSIELTQNQFYTCKKCIPTIPMEISQLLKICPPPFA